MRNFAFAFLILAGCSGQQPRGECGKSFCLPADAKIIARLTPVEDFNFYRMNWHGHLVEIYEGNQPMKRPEATSTTVKLPINSASTLRLYEGGGSILIRMGDDWPEFLEVLGPCSSPKQCPVASFAAELSRR